MFGLQPLVDLPQGFGPIIQFKPNYTLKTVHSLIKNLIQGGGANLRWFLKSHDFDDTIFFVSVATPGGQSALFLRFF